MPLGVGAAIYLTEYATNKHLVNIIEFATETLSGIPSIIYGLVGMLFFVEFCSLRSSLIAGSLTLVILTIPTVIRTTQESLKTVPQSYREGSLGLGAGKWHMIRTVVLPSSVDGIVTGCILAIGRVVGESRSDPDGGDVYVCQGARRDGSCFCHCVHFADIDFSDQFCCEICREEVKEIGVGYGNH